MTETLGLITLLGLFGYGIYCEIRFHRWYAHAFPAPPEDDKIETGLRLGCRKMGCSRSQETRGIPLDPARRALPRGETT